MTKLLKRLLLYAAPIAVLGAGYLIFQDLATSPEIAAPVLQGERAWPVRVTTIQPGPRSPFLKVFGRIESPAHVRLSAAVESTVLEVRAVEGALVSKGETLVVLDSRDARLSVRQREAEVADIRAQIDLETERIRRDREALGKERHLLEIARRQLHRAEVLAQGGSGSQSRLEQAMERATERELAVVVRDSATRGSASRVGRLEAQLARAEAELRRAALALQKTTEISPFVGRITEVLVAGGERVRVGDPLLSLFDVSRLEIRALIPHRYIGDLPTEVYPSGNFEMDGKRFTATVDRLSGHFLPDRGGIDAILSVEGDVEELRIGRTVDVTLTLTRKPDAVWLPPEAMYGTDRVFKVISNRLVRVEVSRIGDALGPNGQSGILVSSPDLTSGDHVVVSQLPNAAEGLRVTSAEARGP